MTGATSLAVGYYHACAIVTGGVAKCWGLNDFGQTGKGSTSAVEPTPVSVNGVNGIVSLALAGLNTCALLGTGSVTCWGSNASGQLGNGTTTASVTPVAVSGVTNALNLDGNASHFCAGSSGGSVKCWGRNAAGQLGNGTTNASSVPVAVVGIP